MREPPAGDVSVQAACAARTSAAWMCWPLMVCCIVILVQMPLTDSQCREL